MQKHYYNNGVIEKVIPEDSIIPEGFIKGRLKSVGKNISKIRRDYTWFNNGLEEIYIKSNLLPPIGFAPGRLPRDKQWSENMSKSHKNFRWYTNGIDNILLNNEEVPPGFYPGRVGKVIDSFKKSNNQTYYYNNGKIDIRLHPNDIIPKGFVKGRSSNKNKPTWCSGLTSQTDIRIKLRGEAISNSFKENKSSAKAYNTRKLNHTFNTSKIEIEAYKYLVSKFGEENIETQYNKDPRYPYNCDFYIKPLDLFIEINNHFTHGPHPFDPNNEEDIKLLEKWEEKAKTSDFYKVAIDVWTRRDINKLNTAKQNNLKYITIYDIRKSSTTIENILLEEISKMEK